MEPFAIQQPSMAPPPTSLRVMQRCEASLHEKLASLHSLHILSHSLRPFDASSDFEILEFYGDSVLYEAISAFFMSTRRFMNPGMLTKLRTAVVRNINLAQCFDLLGMEKLLPPASPTLMMGQGGASMDYKAKADVVEAVLGELKETLGKMELVTHHERIRSFLTEVLSFICFQGEQRFHAETIAASSSTHGSSNSFASPSRKKGRNPSPPKTVETPRASVSPPKKVRAVPKDIIVTPRGTTSATDPIDKIPKASPSRKVTFAPALVSFQKPRAAKEDFRPTSILLRGASTPVTLRPNMEAQPHSAPHHRSTTGHLVHNTTPSGSAATTAGIPQVNTWEELVKWCQSSPPPIVA